MTGSPSRMSAAAAAFAARDAAVAQGEWARAARWAAEGREEVRAALAAGGDAGQIARGLRRDDERDLLDGDDVDDLIDQHMFHDTDTDTDYGGTDPDASTAQWFAQAHSTDPTHPVITFDQSGYYSDADIAAIGDALAAGDSELATRLQNRPWTHQGAAPPGADLHGTDTDTDPFTGGEAVAPVDRTEGVEHTHQENQMSSSTPGTGRHDEGGFVPRLGAEPSTVRYETMTAAEAVERVAAVGFDRADAEHMVTEYLAHNTAEHGEPAGGWIIDTYDLADIAQGYEWVDHYRGETIADARQRAAGYAADYAAQSETIDREREPGRTGYVQREAALWADRAHTPTPSEAVEPAAAEPAAAADGQRGWVDGQAARDGDWDAHDAPRDTAGGGTDRPVPGPTDAGGSRRGPEEVGLQTVLDTDVHAARTALAAAEGGDWARAARHGELPEGASAEQALGALRDEVATTQERQAEYGYGDPPDPSTARVCDRAHHAVTAAVADRGEQGRRTELATWHADDQTSGAHALNGVAAVREW